MKVSRISFPVDSPAHPETPGRMYLDMIAGVLNVVDGTSGVATPVGNITPPINIANIADSTAAGRAVVTAVDADAQRALLRAAPQYLPIVTSSTEDDVLVPADAGSLFIKSFATAHTLTLDIDTFVVGTKVTVVNGGAGELTITAGTATLEGGSGTVTVDGSVTLVYVAADTWRILA